MTRILIGCVLMLVAGAGSQAESLRFYGTGDDDVDRVKIRADRSDIPANIGATDVTIEFWIKADQGNNGRTITPGANYDWIWGNIIFDRDRYDQPRAYGISLTDGRVTFGVKLDSGQRTWRGTTDVRVDNLWRHIAVQRSASTGAVQIYVDGVLEASGPGPAGDMSYPNGGVPRNLCPPGNASCAFSDPYIVIGAEKHDYDRTQAPSFRGWVTEVRLSHVLRYQGQSFTPAAARFTPDPGTAALYHFTGGSPGTPCNTGDRVEDATARSHGECRYGGLSGSSSGPAWSSESPFGPSPGVLRLDKSEYQASEGEASFPVLISRVGGSTGAASVRLALADGTALQGVDYSPPAVTTFNWADGERGAKPAAITIIDDADDEGNETVMLQLTDAVGATVGSPFQAVLTIVDSDGVALRPGVLQLSAEAATVSESAGSVQVTVMRTEGADGEVSVNYATANGSAVNGADYAPLSGVLTFAAGVQSRSLEVNILNDAQVESNETFTIALTAPAGGATVGQRSMTTVTILDDDGSSPPAGGGGGGGGGGGSMSAIMLTLLAFSARGRLCARTAAICDLPTEARA